MLEYYETDTQIYGPEKVQLMDSSKKIIYDSKREWKGRSKKTFQVGEIVTFFDVENLIHDIGILIKLAPTKEELNTRSYTYTEIDNCNIILTKNTIQHIHSSMIYKTEEKIIEFKEYNKSIEKLVESKLYEKNDTIIKTCKDSIKKLDFLNKCKN